MKSLWCAILLIIFIQSPGYSGISIDELRKTVVFVRMQSQEMTRVNDKSAELWYRFPNTKDYSPMIKTETGSGFIIQHNNHNYLVTAKHLAESSLPASEIIMNVNGKGSTITLQALAGANRGAHWFHHPKTDISIYPLTYPNLKADVLSLPECFFPKQEAEIRLLTAAYIVGFPLGLGVQEKLSPIAKEAKIASRLTFIKGNQLPAFLLDQALSQGYSGAPVFYEDMIPGAAVGGWSGRGGATLHLLGLQSSALSDKTGGKISVVIPIAYIWDILESDEFKSYERELARNNTLAGPCPFSPLSQTEKQLGENHDLASERTVR